MVQTTKNDMFFNKTFLEAYTSEVMAKNYITARYLDKKEINAPTVVNYKDETKVDGKILDETRKKARPVTEGTELTEIRANLLVGDTKSLDLYGFKLEVTDEMLADEAFILEKEIRDMSFTLSHLVEQNIIVQLMEQAAAPKPKKADIHGNWANLNDVDEIADDIIEMQSAFDENDWNFELNGLFLNKKQVNAIRKGLDYKVSHYDVNQVKGYPINRSLSFADCIHTKSKFMEDGHAIGFDLNAPPATIYYNGKPNTSTPKVYNGLEDFAPLIRAYIKKDEGVVDKTTFEMAVSFGLVVNKPGALLHMDGL